MRSAARRVLPLLLLPVIAVILGAGCAGALPVASLSSLPSFVTRDGTVRYRVPAGWFDATADSGAIPRIVFLVRGDYAGSIAMRELHVDAAARRDLARTGVLQIARLAAALETGSGRGMIARAPQSIRVNGREGAMYDLAFGGRERVRTVLVDTGARIYSIAALVEGTAAEDAAEEIFAAQQAFLQALAL